MLRVTELPDSPPGLRVEGRLVGPWVAALWTALAATRPARLDVAGVSFADDDGLRLLREALDAGVLLSPRTAFLSDLLHLEVA